MGRLHLSCARHNWILYLILIPNEYYQTSQPSVYAIGDCVGRMPLTPVAIAEGKAVAETLCRGQRTAVDYRWIPSAVFAIPPIASVGWSEETAQERIGSQMETCCKDFTPFSQSLTDTPEKSLIKWVFHKSSRQVLGVHTAGSHAPELLQGLIPGLKKGLTTTELNDTIGIHPTAGEKLFNPPSE